MCKNCNEGKHKSCTGGDCDCPERIQEDQIERSIMVSRQSDERMAETIYTTLLYGGSDVARALTDRAGKEGVRLFVQQVLRAHKAVQC